MKVFRPLFLIVGLILIVGFACSVGSPAKPTEVPTKDVVVVPTAQEEEPTAEEEPTSAPDATEEEAPTDEPSNSEAKDYFTETFDGGLDNYTYFEYNETYKKTKADSTVKPSTKDGFLVFDLKKANKWVYVTYNPFKYTDVRLDLTADNRGKNTNNISLICRYSDEGWYEFNIANSGLYWIYAYIIADGKYYAIYNGGSTEIKQGKDTNEYTAICDGDDLTLGINGINVKTVTDTKYKLRDGKVGFGVSSFNVTPILVEVDSFEVSEP